MNTNPEFFKSCLLSTFIQGILGRHLEAGKPVKQNLDPEHFRVPDF